MSEILPSNTRQIQRQRPVSAIEFWSVLIILAFPVWGTFYPPESYFVAQNFSIEAAEGREIGFPFGRYANIFIIIWLFGAAAVHQRQMIKAVRGAWLPILFTMWMMCTSTFTVDWAASFNRGMRTVVIVVFAAYCVERFTPKQILRLLTLSGSILIFSSIIAVFVLPEYGLTNLTGYEGAWRGAATHKNKLGTSASTLIFLTIFSIRSRAIGKNFGCIILLLSSIVLIKSNSASSIILLISAISAYILFSFINRIKQESGKIIVFASILFSISVIYLAQDIFLSLMELTGRDPTLTGRTDIWAITWELIKHNPIWGYGNNFWTTDSPLREQIWIRLNWASPHAHNTYLDIWFQTGLIGVGLFTCILVMLIMKTMALVFSKRSTFNLLWPALLISMLIRGLTETQFVEPGSGSWFWLTIGIASVNKYLETRTNSKDNRKN